MLESFLETQGIVLDELIAGFLRSSSAGSAATRLPVHREEGTATPSQSAPPWESGHFKDHHALDGIQFCLQRAACDPFPAVRLHKCVGLAAPGRHLCSRGAGGVQ